MSLDDFAHFGQIDTLRMLDDIDDLPAQFARASSVGEDLPLPASDGIRRVVLCGMGGSAIGGDLVRAYAEPVARLPLLVWRGYDLPAALSGPETLLIASSHSGNTEETLAAFSSAQAAGARCLAITRGGKLAELAGTAGVPVWSFEHQGQPRAAVGWSAGLLLSVLSRLGVIPDQQAQVGGAVSAMREQQEDLRAEVPVVNNPAKRMAGQFTARHVVIVGGGLLAPVARRWRTQLAEMAKAVAQFEVMPEADHNMVAGVMQPDRIIEATMLVFLTASQDDPRLLRRAQATRQIMMVEGFNTDRVESQGNTRLAQQWTSLHFGDYVAFYLAMAYGLDPTPIPTISELKTLLADS
jgi:glucose/mannose-6-phosphate isomerase